MSQVQNPDGSFHHRAVIHSVTFVFPDNHQEEDVLECWQDPIAHIDHIINDDNPYRDHHGQPIAIKLTEERYKKYSYANQYYKERTIVKRLDRDDIKFLNRKNPNRQEFKKRLFGEAKSVILNGHSGPSNLHIIHPNGEMKKDAQGDQSEIGWKYCPYTLTPAG